MSYQPSGQVLAGRSMANWPAWVITSASGPRSICSKEISRAGFFFQHQPTDPPALDESVQHSLRMQKVEKATQTLMLSADGILRVCKMREPVCRRETHEST